MTIDVRKIVTVVGARPQFIKASAVSRRLAARPDLEEVLVHTGQHYDPEMSDRFFEELAIPRPKYALGVGSGNHGAQTAEILRRVEDVLLEVKPAAVMVYGDTNSTLAGALADVKLHVPIAHVEAGLRSFNRRMPEEINRVLTDRVSSLLFCPTMTAVNHLASEGIVEGVHHVGDVMYDVALAVAERAERSPSSRIAGLSHRGFVLATVHRAENTDVPTRLESICRALSTLASDLPVVFPVHPRTRKALAGSSTDLSALRLVDPVGIVDMTWLERHAALVVTDSGGVQKEAYFHRTPCVTVRTETEWVETVSTGWNRLAKPDDSAEIVVAARAALAGPAPSAIIADYGSGNAAERVVETLATFVS